MKKLFFVMLMLVLASGLVFSLSGCGSSGATPAQAASAPLIPAASSPSSGSVIAPGPANPGSLPDRTNVYSVQLNLVPSKTVYQPGETISMEVTLANDSTGNAGPVFVSPFPPGIDIIEPGSSLPPAPGAATPVVKSLPAGTGEKEMSPGDKVTYSLTWDQKDESGNQVAPGWYNYQFKYNIRQASSTQTVGSGGSAPAFLIQYPQGAMQKTLEPDQSQTIRGFPFTTMDGKKYALDLVLTLKQVILSENGASFFVTASSPDNPVAGYNYPEWISGIHSAQYIVDGVTRDARASNTRAADSGLELRWGYDDSHLDPVPSDAKQLTFVITHFGTWQGHLEFNVPLE